MVLKRGNFTGRVCFCFRRWS